VSESQKYELAQRYLFQYGQNIINSTYGGGENVYFTILQTYWNCSNSTFTVYVRFNFTGQFTGINYWAKGRLIVDGNSGKVNYNNTEMDPALESALKIQNIIIQEGYKILLN